MVYAGGSHSLELLCATTYLQGVQAGCCLYGLLIVCCQVLQAPKACSTKNYLKSEGDHNIAKWDHWCMRTSRLACPVARL